MSKSLLDIILRVVKQGTGSQDVKNDLEDLGKQGEKTGSQFSILDGVMLGAGNQIVNLGMSAIKALPELYEMGIAAQRSEVALKAYAGGGRAAEEMLNAVQDATGGTISKMDAMQNATRLLSMGLAENADEAAKLTRIATTLGATMGKGPKEAFEEFTLLLANQSILRLDTFGISGAKVKERMEELANDGIAEADRQTRFLIATMEEAEGKLNALDEAGFNATSSLDRFNATMDDLKVGFATWVAEGANPWLDGIFAVIDATKEQNQRFLESTNTIEEYRDAVKDMPIYFYRLTEEEYNAQKAQLALNKALEMGDTAIDGWNKGLQTTNKEAGEAEQKTRNLALSLQKVTDARLAAEAMEHLNEAYKKASEEELPELESIFVEVATKIGGLDSDTVKAQLALARLERDWEDQGTAVNDVVDDLLELGNEFDLLPESIYIPIELDVKGLDDLKKIPGGGGDNGGDDKKDEGDGGGGGCFAPGTLVNIYSGFKVIEEIKVGDLVWSYDENLEKPVMNEVAEIFQFERDDLLEVIFNDSSFICSPEHPWFDIKAGWVETRDLTKENKIMLVEGGFDEIKGIIPCVGKSKVYTFSVAKTQSYFVYNHLVHNKVKMQFGGQFLVEGSPGIDRVPVNFMATRGETVTVTPQGETPPGTNINVSIPGAQIVSDMDFEEFAWKLASRIQEYR